MKTEIEQGIFTLATAAILVLSACGSNVASQATAPMPVAKEKVAIVAPATANRAKFAQKITGTLLLVGQEKVGIDNYRKAIGEPAGLMFYTDLIGQAGLTDFIGGSSGTCDDAGTTDLQHYIGGAAPTSPRAIIQLGLSLTGGGQLASVVAGTLDNKIRALATVLKNTGHPVFLRIGYEAEGPWNNYSPADYVPAFQRIVAIVRGGTVDGKTGDAADNVAMVWHLAAGNGTPNNIAAWYPGDAFVDWIGVSWFGQGASLAGAAADANAREVVAAFAKTHSKPMMIAESAPRDFSGAPNNQSDPNIPTALTSWDAWYKPVLEWNERHQVRIWSYINQDWRAYPMFAGACGNGGNIWGNSRVEQSGSMVKTSWQSMLSAPSTSWPVKADSANLLCEIGFQTAGCKP
jgi:hypothetical protein